jgi:Tol biopolymer transport system component
VWRAARTPTGWSAPERLVAEVNSPGPELGPALHDGWLYFGSARRGGAGGLDLYRARVSGAGFQAAETLGAAVNGAGSEGDPEISRDGRTLLFWSDRPGGAGEGDLHLARRTADGWSAPQPVAAANSPRFDFTPSISPDGRWLYFASTRTEAPGAPADVLGGESNIYRIPLPRACPAAR